MVLIVLRFGVDFVLFAPYTYVFIYLVKGGLLSGHL